MACKAAQLSGWIDSDHSLDTTGDDFVAGQPMVLTTDGWILATSPGSVLGVAKNDMREALLVAPKAADSAVTSFVKGAVLMGVNKVILTAGKLRNGTSRYPFALPPTGGSWAIGDDLYVGATGLWDNVPATPDDPSFGIVTLPATTDAPTLEAVTTSMAGFEGLGGLGGIVGGAQHIITSGATAISLTTRTTRADGNAATDDITSTLADGTFDGQRKSLVLSDVTALKNWVVTVTSFQDGTTVTLDTALDGAELEWSESLSKWFTVALTGNASVA